MTVTIHLAFLLSWDLQKHSVIVTSTVMRWITERSWRKNMFEGDWKYFCDVFKLLWFLWKPTLDISRYYNDCWQAEAAMMLSLISQAQKRTQRWWATAESSYQWHPHVLTQPIVSHRPALLPPPLHCFCTWLHQNYNLRICFHHKNVKSLIVPSHCSALIWWTVLFMVAGMNYSCHWF